MGLNGNWTIDVTGRGAYDVAQHVQTRASIENPDDNDWEALRDLDSVESLSGESVTPKKALSIPALYQAVSMISGDVAKIPLASFRRLEEGGRQLDRQHHAFKRINLVAKANPEINAYKFWRRLMVSALLWNNGYAWIDKNGRGEVLGLYNLLPDRTTPVRMKGQLWYLTEVRGRLEALPADEVFHIEGLSLDGFHGENLVKLFRDLFGQAIAKRKFASKFFKNGMMAGGVLAVPPGAKPATVKKIQARLREKYSNTDNAFRTIVLRDGYKWFSTQVDPQKGQMTESNEQDARDVARIFNLRASRLSVEGSSSYNSDEMAIRDYHDGTLSHWLIGTRCECNAKLRTPEEIERDEVYIDYIINALQWADAETRSNIANKGIQNGRWSPNETREWENLNPYDGGDAFYRPLNLEPVGSTDADDDDASANDDRQRGSAEGYRRAATSLAQATIRRATNRLAIKAKRAKARQPGAEIRFDDAEREAVLEMIGPACQVLGRNITAQWKQIEELAKR